MCIAVYIVGSASRLDQLHSHQLHSAIRCGLDQSEGSCPCLAVHTCGSTGKLTAAHCGKGRLAYPGKSG